MSIDLDDRYEGEFNGSMYENGVWYCRGIGMFLGYWNVYEKVEKVEAVGLFK